MNSRVNVNDGNLALIASLTSLILCFSVVFFSIENAGIPYASVLGWFCFITFFISLILSARSISTGNLIKGGISIFICCISILLLAAFRHVI